MENLKTKKLKLISISVIAFLILSPIFQAHAEGSYLTGLASNVIENAIATVLSFIRAVMTSWIALMGSWVDQIIKQPITQVQIVQDSWELTRNFANMFFIIALIIMAFATIFSIGSFQQYSFTSLIGRFLIAALLINFSLVIGEVIIDWSTSLSNVFLQAIGDVGARVAQGANLGDRFGAELSVQLASSTDLSIWQETIAVFANIVLLSIILFSMGVLLFFSIIRVPIIWALLIVSPLAWILYILPSTKKYSQQWWDYFISWNLFMPVYLFFIYFGLLFLNKQQEILTGAAGGVALIPGLNAGLQTIFFYVMIGMFLIWGAKAAMSFSRAGGAGAIAGWAYGKGAVMRRTAWRGTGIPGAYKEAKERIQKEGFAGTRFEKIPVIGGYKGERGAEDRAAAIAGFVGIPGVAEKQLTRNVDSTTKRLKERGVNLDRSELERLLDNGTPEERISAAQIYAEENYGALTPERMTKLKESFGGKINTSLAASTFRKQKWGEMPSNELREFLNPKLPNGQDNPNYIEDANIRSLIYSALIEKAPTPTELQAALKTARPGQGGGLIKKARETIAKSFDGSQRQTLLEALNSTPDPADPTKRIANPELARQNADTIRELLGIMAGEGDDFFYALDPSGNLDQAQTQTKLANAARSFENIGDRKKFFEDISKKHAHSAAVAMLADTEIKLRDAAGNEIKTGMTNISGAIMTPGELELEAMKAVSRKLSIDDKESQNKKQYANSTLQKAFGEDMTRNLESWSRNDKFITAQANLIPAQRDARREIFRSEHLGPFNTQSIQLKTKLDDLYAHPPAAQALNSTKQELSTRMLKKLSTLRDDYEKLCLKNNLMADPVDKTEVEADIKHLDAIIESHSNRIANLNSTP